MFEKGITLTYSLTAEVVATCKAIVNQPVVACKPQLRPIPVYHNTFAMTKNSNSLSISAAA